MANVGKWDKIIRLSIGGTLELVAFLSDKISSAGLKWGLVAVGAVLIITAVVGTCPIYKMLKISTAKDAEKKPEQEIQI